MLTPLKNSQNTNSRQCFNVIAVDDDDMNLMILVKIIKDMALNVVSFDNSEQALNYIQHNPEKIDIAVLDKMMPPPDGMEILRSIKNNEQLKHIPVILQTGDAGVQQMKEGMEAGALYYLTKPFHPDILKAMLHSAIIECELRAEIEKNNCNDTGKSIFLMMQKGEFHFQTPQEAKQLAGAIASLCIDSKKTAAGLMELMMNAIEHGNLGMGSVAKQEAIAKGIWEQEIAKRTTDPVNQTKRVILYYHRQGYRVEMLLQDDGKGFDIARYQEKSAAELLHSTDGNGIGRALLSELKNIVYHPPGNRVSFDIELSPAKFANNCSSL